MRRALRSFAAALALALGVACNPGGGAPTGDLVAAPGTTRVERRGDAYDVQVNGDSAWRAVEELSVVAGFRAERGHGDLPEDPVYLRLEGTDVDTALAAILRGVPHHVHYEFVGEPVTAPPWPDRPVALRRVTVGSLWTPERRIGPPGLEPGRGVPGFVRAARDEAALRPQRTSELELEIRREPDAREEILERALADDHPDVRAEAVALLEPEGDELEILAQRLALDESPEVRVAAAEALARGHGYRTTPRLLDALDDPDPSVVVAAISALEDAWADRPLPEVRERVAALRSHEDEAVREAAADFEAWIEE